MLAYGGWTPSRWGVVRTIGYNWPIQFRPKKLDVYVAYYTDVDPNADTIEEDLRPGSKRLWRLSELWKL